ncbi:MAG: polyphosphate kinase 2 family protein [Planctomycetaceae bacterium]|nr:polyphosphate kinase 2 family protein [Planctomycetaceae bacterium]
MAPLDEILNRFRVEPGRKCKLKDHDPGWEGNEDIPEADRRITAGKILEESVAQVAEAQQLLYAADSWSILVILQAMDAAGKDGTIKHVMSGVNPQGVTVTSFKHPSAIELDHNFLWRCTAALPERGHIGIFNRSYYEEVLIVKVHPEFVKAQRIPAADPDRKKFWKGRYDDINAFERHLVRNGTRILKIFLNVSKQEQRERFLARLNDPAKHWKFSSSDLHERAYWDDYQKAFGEMLTETSTKWAPWYVVPADSKWVSRAVVAKLLAREITSLDLQYPQLDDDQRAALAAARAELEAEGD